MQFHASDTLFDFFLIEDLIKNNDRNILQTKYYNLHYIFRSGEQPIELEIGACERVTIPPRTLAYLPPRKKITILNNSGRAFLFVFSTDFFERNKVDRILLNTYLFNKRNEGRHDILMINALTTEEDFFSFFVKKLQQLKHRSTELYLLVAHNCIESLLLTICIFLPDASNTAIQKVDGEKTHYEYLRVVSNFKALLRVYILEEKTVEFYASELHVTPRYLSIASEKILNKTAKEVINEKVIKVAKRLLTYSGLNIVDISNCLGFKEASNFSAFFKKHTEINPKDFLRLKNKVTER